MPRSSFATWSICHLFTSRRNCRIYRYYVSVLSLKSDDCKSNNAASNLFRAFAFFIKKINDDSKVIYEIASIIIVKGVFIEEIFFTE